MISQYGIDVSHFKRYAEGIPGKGPGPCNGLPSSVRLEFDPGHEVAWILLQNNDVQLSEIERRDHHSIANRSGLI
jgi:hypothetical protein